jgi:hypothetical protein
MEVTMTDEHKSRTGRRSYKLILLFSMVNDYDVCRSYQCICGKQIRVDWLTDFELPTAALLL